jgi:hypothetical protein
VILFEKTLASCLIAKVAIKKEQTIIDYIMCARNRDKYSYGVLFNPRK